MAYARRRHYRVAQKAAEAQVNKRVVEQRNDSILIFLIVFILVTQICSLIILVNGLFSCGESDKS